MGKSSESIRSSDAGQVLLLRRLDQAAIALLLAVSLILMAIPVWLRHRQKQERIEIDRAPPLVIHFRVDINRAGWPELALLPGVGETLARRIIESRDREGLFEQHHDLLRVPGIGPVTLEQIAPYLLALPVAPDRGGCEQPSGSLDSEPDGV